MGDIRIDQWCWKMAEHRRKGHRIIQYPDMDVIKRVSDIKDIKKQDLLLKDKRAAFWEEHHSIPTTDDLIWREPEAE